MTFSGAGIFEWSVESDRGASMDHNLPSKHTRDSGVSFQNRPPSPSSIAATPHSKPEVFESKNELEGRAGLLDGYVAQTVSGRVVNTTGRGADIYAIIKTKARRRTVRTLTHPKLSYPSKLPGIANCNDW